MVHNPLLSGEISDKDLITGILSFLESKGVFTMPDEGVEVAWAHLQTSPYQFMFSVPGLPGLTEWSLRIRTDEHDRNPVCVFFDILPSYLKERDFEVCVQFVSEDTYLDDKITQLAIAKTGYFDSLNPKLAKQAAKITCQATKSKPKSKRKSQKIARRSGRK